MYSFEYYNPVKIIFGKDSIEKIGDEISANAKILISYGRGSIKKNGVYKQVTKALSNHSFIEFGGIEPNPEYETLMKAVNLVKNENIDFLLAVGGGSVLDGTKFIAAAANYSGADAWDILSKGAKITKALPLASILTLPATGSEMNAFAVVSRREMKQKLAFGSPLVFPQFSVLDPGILQSLPTRQKINGVVDAFVHVLEQYLTFPNEAEVQDQWAEGVLRTLIKYGQDYVNQDFDYDKASNIMWAATSALNGMIGSGVAHDWATHAIGHEITALYGLDHAQTLAIILPGMMRVMASEKDEKLRRFAANVFHISKEEYSLNQVIKRTEEFFHSLGMKTTFSDYQIAEKGFDDIIKGLSKSGDIRLGEKGTLNEERVRELLILQK